MNSTHSGVEVTQENKLFLAGDAADGGCELVVKLVLAVQCGRKCQGIHADEGDRACRGVDVEGVSEPLLPVSTGCSSLQISLHVGVVCQSSSPSRRMYSPFPSKIQILPDVFPVE